MYILCIYTHIRYSHIGRYLNRSNIIVNLLGSGDSGDGSFPWKISHV